MDGGPAGENGPWVGFGVVAAVGQGKAASFWEAAELGTELDPGNEDGQ